MSVPGTQCEVRFMVNGEPKIVRTHPMARLLDVLREQLGFTGAKEGCGEGECGSCSVIMDGALVNSCLVPVLQAHGMTIITVEGLAQGSRLSALQRSLLESGGSQCGICTPGILMAAHHLLSRTLQPTSEEIREGLSGNLCRCTGYAQICEAVEQTATPANSSRAVSKSKQR
jgi:aerobic carbon-monoxide dehydrogenase small subunit